MKYDHHDPVHREQLGRQIVSTLKKAGFVESRRGPSGRRLVKRGERIFDRKVAGTNAFVRVYTSVVGKSVRAVGADAVRVVGLMMTDLEDPWIYVPVAKTTRVHRTGTMTNICERMLSRVQEVFEATKVAAKKKCPECGASMRLSKKNNLFCSALCWKK